MHYTVAQKPLDATAPPVITREIDASHLVSQSRLQVTCQSYILEVSHIHLCDWRHSLVGCWHGYLSAARCRLAYGPADVTATHYLLLQ